MTEKTSADNGIPGIFYFRNKNLLKSLPKSGEFVKWCSSNIKNFYTKKINNLKELGDFSTIERSYNKIGYGRFFNKIKISKKFDLKKSIDKNYDHLIKKELKWYDEVSNLGYKDIPKIYNKKNFKMERVKGKHLFQYDNLEKKKYYKII